MSLPARWAAAALLWGVLLSLAPQEGTAQAPPLGVARSGGPSELAAVGDRVLFVSAEGGVVTLWTSDGTPSGTRNVRSFDRYASAQIVRPVEDVLFFTTGFGLEYASGGGESYRTLWVTDGTGEGTRELATGSAPYYGSKVPQGIRQPSPGSCRFSVIGRDGMYFFTKTQSGLDGDHSRSELYSYRRGAAEARRIFDAPGESHIPLLAVDAGRLYFSRGAEIWSADGDSASRLFRYAPQGGYPSGDLGAQVGDRHFHAGTDASHGTELWVRTAAGDVLLKDINRGVNSSDPCCFARYGDLLVFSAETLEHGRELWASDGTVEGTRLLMDLAPGPADSSPDHFSPIPGGLAFVTNRGELWKTAGTPEGTRMISPSLSRSVEFRKEAPRIGGAYVHSANPAGSEFGYELYRSESGRVRLIKDINPGRDGSDPHGFVPLGEAVFFSAADGAHGRELWVTDGTETGTRLVADLAPGTGGVDLQEAVVWGDRLCFVAVGDDRKPGLYLSDGTAAGTLAVATFPAESTPLALTPLGTSLFYLVSTFRETEDRSDGIVVVESFARTGLWRSDGSSAGTVQLLEWEGTAVDSYELPDPFGRDEIYHQIP